MQTANEWITMKEAMKLLQITSRTTLYDWGKKYGFKVTKLSGKTYFNRLDIGLKMEANSFVLGL